MNVPIGLLKTEWPNEGLAPGNKRFDKVYKSIEKNGILEPLTINLKWVVINGNHRLAVARRIGIERVNVQVWTGTEMLI